MESSTLENPMIKSTPIPKSKEKRKEGFLEPEYFNLQLEFAKAIAEKTGMGFGDVLLKYTDFYRRFRLPRMPKPDRMNPVWQEYVEKVNRGADPLELSYEFYIRANKKKSEKTPEEKEQKRKQSFGMFHYDCKNGVIQIHFDSRGDNNVGNMPDRKKELADMFASVKIQYPEANKVTMTSWLLGLRVARKFLPEVCLDQARIDTRGFDAGSRWGQFIDYSGKVKPKLKENFLEKLKELNEKNPSEIFPIQTVRIDGDIEEFYRFYGISN